MTGIIEKLLAAFSRAHWLLQWLILSLLALLLYIPVIGNYFVNDDFTVLKKVCLDKELNVEGFFRPLSDISIYANYMFSGFDPLAYRITSIVVHAFNALLLFRFCKRWQWAGAENLFAGIATIFFLTYPFHNEPVVWLLGRASLLASTFAMLALVIVAACHWRDAWKMPLAAICYFIAMTGYESVFVLPAIVFIWLLANAAPFKKIMIWMGVFALVLIVHFVIRVQVSGSAAGEYGSNLFAWDITESFARAAKAAGRLLAPPFPVSSVFVVLTALAGLAILIAIIKTWRKSAAKKYIRVQLLAWLSMLLIAMVVPFVIGVSTKTSESDRLLYYPSFFFCALLAFFLLHLVSKRKLAWLAAGIIIYNVIFLYYNNTNWQKASYAVTSLLKIIKEKPPATRLYIRDMPEQINGAYVFRVGFRDALLVNNLDTVNIVVSNKKLAEPVKEPYCVAFRRGGRWMLVKY